MFILIEIFNLAMMNYFHFNDNSYFLFSGAENGTEHSKNISKNDVNTSVFFILNRT